MSFFMQRQRQRKKKACLLEVDEDDVGSGGKNVHGGRSNRICWFVVCETMCRSKVIYVETRVIVWLEIMIKKLVSDVMLFTKRGRSIKTEARTSYKSEGESIQRKEKASTR
ncbi:hypothetical protein Bca101_099182 [Brassica carinata]